MRYTVSHSNSDAPLATVSLDDDYVLISLTGEDVGFLLERDHGDGDGPGYLHYSERGLHKDPWLTWLDSRDPSMEVVAEGGSLAYAVADLASRMAS